MNRLGKTAPLLASCLLATLCFAPAWAQAPAPPPETAFGQEMPKQYFINRLTNPSRETIEQAAREEAESKPTTSREPGRAAVPVEAGKAPPPGEAGGRTPSVEAAGEQPANNGAYYDPYPKQFLLNRMLGSGGQ